MAVMLTYTDPDWVEQGTTSMIAFDMAFGNDENDFSLVVPKEVFLYEGSLVYIDGTEYGGIVRNVIDANADGVSEVSYVGETWHGIMAGRCLRPDPGKDWLSVSGEANRALLHLVARCGLSDLFSVSSADSGITIDHQFERFEDAYSGIRKMLAASSAKLCIVKEPGKKPVLSAVPRRSCIDTEDAGRFGYKISVETPVNHLVCLGKGDLAERTIVDLYADVNGNVSETQTIFGRDYRQAVYELPNAERDELIESGKEKLESMQDTLMCELYLPDDESFDIGDIVGVVSSARGISASSDVTKVIVKSDGAGGLAVSNEIGDVTVSSARSVSSGGSAGGTYTSGEGIEIVGGVIRAKVTPPMLDAVSIVANDALSAASGASASAGAALAAAGENVASISATSPLSDKRSGQNVALSHEPSGVAAGAYGPAANATPGWGETVTVGARTSVNATGHITSMQGRTITMPSSEATPDVKGLMSAADKRRVDAYPWGDIDGKPKSYPPASHDHNYAASSKAGGAATSADKFSAKRIVKILGAVKGQAEWDGAGDLEITVSGDSESAGFLAAHPVGCYYPTSLGDDPGAIYGGTWDAAPSLGPHWWHRIG